MLKTEIVGYVWKVQHSMYSKVTSYILIQHIRNGCEFRPELPHYSVDGYCAEARTMYEFLRCYYHGCTCQTFRDVKMLGGDTLSERFKSFQVYYHSVFRREESLCSHCSLKCLSREFTTPTLEITSPSVEWTHQSCLAVSISLQIHLFTKRFKSFEIVSSRFKSFEIVPSRFKSFEIVPSRSKSFQIYYHWQTYLQKLNTLSPSFLARNGR
jgi:hypothetical protein